MSTNGIVHIHGREYQTVALRVHNFRAQFPEHSLITEVLHRDNECVVVRARIADSAGRTLATGHAEEYRKASAINKTSALENAETSAIGRALAGLGLGGTEFASADEVARAVSGEKATIDQRVDKPKAPYPLDKAIVEQFKGADSQDTLLGIWSDLTPQQRPHYAAIKDQAKARLAA